MADIRINGLPSGTPSQSDYVPVDGITTRKVTVKDLVEVGRPVASQAEAEAGGDNVKVMTPLTVKQSIFANGATAEQGAKADSALQPSRTLTGGTGIAAIGDLSVNRTIALNAASIASLALADGSLQKAGGNMSGPLGAVLISYPDQTTPATPAAGNTTVYGKAGRLTGLHSDGYEAPYLILGGEIRQNLTLNCTDYASMVQQINYLAPRAIAAGVRAKIKAANGTYTMADQIIPKHPQGGQIDFEGNLTNPELVILNFDATSNKSGFGAVDGYTIGSIDGFRINGVGGNSGAGVWAANSYGAALYTRGSGSKILRIGSKIRIHNYYYAVLGEECANFTCDEGVEAYDAGDCAFHTRNHSFGIARGCKVFGARHDGPGLGFGFGSEWNSGMDCSRSFATGCQQAGFVSQGTSNVLALGITSNNNNKAANGGSGVRINTNGGMNCGYDPVMGVASNLDNNCFGINVNGGRVFFGHTSTYIGVIRNSFSHGILIDGAGHAQGSYTLVQNNGGYGISAVKKSLGELYSAIGSATGNVLGATNADVTSTIITS